MIYEINVWGNQIPSFASFLNRNAQNIWPEYFAHLRLRREIT